MGFHAMCHSGQGAKRRCWVKVPRAAETPTPAEDIQPDLPTPAMKNLFGGQQTIDNSQALVSNQGHDISRFMLDALIENGWLVDFYKLFRKDVISKVSKKHNEGVLGRTLTKRRLLDVSNGNRNFFWSIEVLRFALLLSASTRHVIELGSG